MFCFVLFYYDDGDYDDIIIVIVFACWKSLCFRRTFYQFAVLLCKGNGSVDLRMLAFLQMLMFCLTLNSFRIYFYLFLFYFDNYLCGWSRFVGFQLRINVFLFGVYIWLMFVCVGACACKCWYHLRIKVKRKWITYLFWVRSYEKKRNKVNNSGWAQKKNFFFCVSQNVKSVGISRINMRPILMYTSIHIYIYICVCV